MRHSRQWVLVWVGVLLGIQGCQQEQRQPAAHTPPEPNPQTIPVLDARQQQLYAISCKNCHEQPNNPAPQRGDQAAWQVRLHQGLPKLVEHAMTGFQAMPAGGLCTVCTADDFRILTAYLVYATPAGGQ